MHHKICPEYDELCVAYIVWMKIEGKYGGHYSTIKMKIHVIPKTRDSKIIFFFYFMVVMTRISLTKFFK